MNEYVVWLRDTASKTLKCVILQASSYYEASLAARSLHLGHTVSRVYINDCYEDD
jgi:hypothetical protein